MLARGGALPAPDEVDSVVGTEWFLYLVLLVATLLLGTCEVLHDNSAQTFLPAVVDDADLEQANGQMYSAEIVANQFAGPPLASLLLATGFVLPILFDAGSFAAAAGLVFTIVATRRGRAGPGPGRRGRPFKQELAEGFRWLWHHPLLRTFAITLGFLNMLGQVYFADDRALRPGGAEHVGVPVRPDDDAVRRRRRPRRVARVARSPSASAPAPRCSSRCGPAASCVLLAGFVSQWPLVALLLGLTMFTGILWNVITVSLRQSVIPDRLLGRVNSVYRFFGWGMMPIGSLIGGGLVAVLDGPHLAGVGAADAVDRGRRRAARPRPRRRPFPEHVPASTPCGPGARREDLDVSAIGTATR